MTTISTYDFTIADRIQSGLQKCVGKEKACKTKVMIMRLKRDGYKVNGAKIRELIHYLRTERKIFICGDSSGYYVPETEDEALHQLRSLKSRIREITEAYNALKVSHSNKFKQTLIFE